MPRTLPVFAAFVLTLGVADRVGAQDRVLPIVARVTPLAIEVHGTVVDDAGARVEGVSVLAIGATLAMVRSDEMGRFSLRLPPGPYVLRATRDGYLSTYREALDVTPDLAVSRRITLTRSGPAAVQLASIGATDSAQAVRASSPMPAPAGGEVPEQGSSETAWRLRHLPRTILRDGSAFVPGDAADEPWAAPHGLLTQTATSGPARAMSAFLTDTDFSGHIDFLTTSSLDASGDDTLREWPRGVAYVVFGAPVGGRGDWAVRAAWTGGDFTSWTLLGEYQARPDQPHVLRTGVSYSAQVQQTTDASQAVTQAFPGARRVGGAYLSDHWTVARGVAVDYGGRVDRYDYLAAPNLASGTVGVRVAIAPRTTLVARLSPSMVAPGADQFLPPATTGAWLPPERTFSALERHSLLRPEIVERYDVLMETRLRANDLSPRVRMGRFAELVDDQIATLFGLDTTSGSAHYFISSPGDVRLDGWTIGAGGSLLKYLQAGLDYRFVRAQWSGADPRSALPAAAPSAARRGDERSHDVTASLDADLAATSTRINLSYRMNTRFSTPTSASPLPGGRFKVEVRQQLPFQPLKGQLNLLVSARTLLHELDEQGAYFDELLTVAPPVRVTCGLQMRF